MNIPASNAAPLHPDRAPQKLPAASDTAPAAKGAPAGDVFEVSPAGREASAEARIAHFEAKTQGRLELLDGRVPESARHGLERSSQAFTQHIARVQAGIESGGLDAAGVARGLQHALSFLRENVQAALRPAEPTAALEVSPDGPATRPANEPAAGSDVPVRANDPTTAADPPARARLERFGQHIAERLAQLDLGSLFAGQESAVGAAQNRFAATLQRLDHAAFDKGAITREQFTSVLQSAIDELKGSLGELLAGRSEAGIDPQIGAGEDA